MRHADYLVDMGPGAGLHGGHIVAEGPPEVVMQNPRSLTGKYLSGELKIEVPKERRKPASYITIKGAKENNLKQLTVQLPLGVLCGITGVSGSGKSTLMNQTVIPALRQMFGEQVDRIGKHDSLEVPEIVRNVIVIDQDPNRTHPTQQSSHLPPNSSTKSVAYSPPPKKQKHAATRKVASALTLKAVDAKHAKATEYYVSR